MLNQRLVRDGAALGVENEGPSTQPTFPAKGRAAGKKKSPEGELHVLDSDTGSVRPDNPQRPHTALTDSRARTRRRLPPTRRAAWALSPSRAHRSASGVRAPEDGVDALARGPRLSVDAVRFGARPVLRVRGPWHAVRSVLDARCGGPGDSDAASAAVVELLVETTEQGIARGLAAGPAAATVAASVPAASDALSPPLLRARAARGPPTGLFEATHTQRHEARLRRAFRGSRAEGAAEAAAEAARAESPRADAEEELVDVRACSDTGEELEHASTRAPSATHRPATAADAALARHIAAKRARMSRERAARFGATGARRHIRPQTAHVPQRRPVPPPTGAQRPATRSERGSPRGTTSPRPVERPPTAPVSSPRPTTAAPCHGGRRGAAARGRQSPTTPPSATGPANRVSNGGVRLSPTPPLSPASEARHARAPEAAASAVTAPAGPQTPSPTAFATDPTAAGTAPGRTAVRRLSTAFRRRRSVDVATASARSTRARAWRKGARRQTSAGGAGGGVSSEGRASTSTLSTRDGLPTSPTRRIQADEGSVLVRHGTVDGEDGTVHTASARVGSNSLDSSPRTHAGAAPDPVRRRPAREAKTDTHLQSVNQDVLRYELAVEKRRRERAEQTAEEARATLASAKQRLAEAASAEREAAKREMDTLRAQLVSAESRIKTLIRDARREQDAHKKESLTSRHQLNVMGAEAEAARAATQPLREIVTALREACEGTLLRRKAAGDPTPLLKSTCLLASRSGAPSRVLSTLSAIQAISSPRTAHRGASMLSRATSGYSDASPLPSPSAAGGARAWGWARRQDSGFADSMRQSRHSPMQSTGLGSPVALSKGSVGEIRRPWREHDLPTLHTSKDHAATGAQASPRSGTTPVSTSGAVSRAASMLVSTAKKRWTVPASTRGLHHLLEADSGSDSDHDEKEHTGDVDDVGDVDGGVLLGELIGRATSPRSHTAPAHRPRAAEELSPLGWLYVVLRDAADTRKRLDEMTRKATRLRRLIQQLRRANDFSVPRLLADNKIVRADNKLLRAAVEVLSRSDAPRFRGMPRLEAERAAAREAGLSTGSAEAAEARGETLQALDSTRNAADDWRAGFRNPVANGLYSLPQETAETRAYKEFLAALRPSHQHAHRVTWVQDRPPSPGEAPAATRSATPGLATVESAESESDRTLQRVQATIDMLKRYSATRDALQSSHEAARPSASGQASTGSTSAHARRPLSPPAPVLDAETTRVPGHMPAFPTVPGSGRAATYAEVCGHARSVEEENRYLLARTAGLELALREAFSEQSDGVESAAPFAVWPTSRRAESDAEAAGGFRGAGIQPTDGRTVARHDHDTAVETGIGVGRGEAGRRDAPPPLSVAARVGEDEAQHGMRAGIGALSRSAEVHALRQVLRTVLLATGPIPDMLASTARVPAREAEEGPVVAHGVAVPEALAVAARAVHGAGRLGFTAALRHSLPAPQVQWLERLFDSLEEEDRATERRHAVARGRREASPLDASPRQ